MKFLPSLIVPKDQLKWFPWTEYLACTNVKVAAKVKADAILKLLVDIETYNTDTRVLCNDLVHEIWYLYILYN